MEFLPLWDMAISRNFAGSAALVEVCSLQEFLVLHDKKKWFYSLQTWNFKCIYNIAVDTVMNVSLTLYIIRWICIVSDSFWRSLYDPISSTALSQLSADRPPSCCLLASRLANQIWTSPLSVRPATFACIARDENRILSLACYPANTTASHLCNCLSSLANR